MKVLYIIDYKTVGGATHSFIEMVVQLKSMGVEPIVCIGKKTNIINFFEKENVQYICTGHRTVLEPFTYDGIGWPLRFIKKYSSFWLNELIAFRRLYKIDWTQIDLIHTNSARNDLGCFVSKKYGIPHVMHIREFADSDFNCITFRSNYIHIFNQYSHKFISISEAVKNHWVGKGLDANKVEVIYNGIRDNDISRSLDDDKRKYFKMLIAGGVTPAKGQHLAVEALGLLPPIVRDNVSLDIMGWYEEWYVSEMKNYAKTRGFQKQVCFLGSVKDVHERLGGYQIGLMCSRAEGFGRVTAEYMHGRLGVIASDSGANPELIEDGVTGLLFRSGDAKSLADCIMRFYNDRDLLIKLSNAAQKKARELYTQQKNAESIYEIYKQILNKEK